MNYKELPKIDLHCHLDGSLRPETIIEIAKKDNIELPSYNIDEIRKLLIAPDKCKSLDEYLLRFELPIKVMQTSENLKRISFEVFEDAALENVKYMEVRFGPLLHTMAGLDVRTIIKSVVDGMKKAEEKYDIKGNIILSFLRTMNKDRVEETLLVGKEFLGNGVCAVDLASSEIKGFSKEFQPYINKASEIGYKITIHAGETGVGSNVSDAINDLNATRIGHGIYISDDKYAYDLVKKEEVILEVCPTSNIQTDAVESLAKHPIIDFYKDGIKVTINTDNRTVSDTTMTKEVEKIFELYNLELSDYRKIYTTSVNSAYTTKEIKEKLLKKI